MQAGSPHRAGTLRAKLLLSLTTISALLTSAVLLIVQYRVRIHVREEIAQTLASSVITFESLQRQREAALGRTAALLATLPPLKAVMTSDDAATIQDASATFWKLAGSQVFVLANKFGEVVAVHSNAHEFRVPAAQAAITRSLATGESRDWWFGDGHVFQVFLEPIYLGAPEADSPLGIVAVGFEIDRSVADDVTRIASSQVAFSYQKTLIISTVDPAHAEDLARHVGQPIAEHGPQEIRLGTERFLSTSVRLSQPNAPLVVLTLLKSVDEATAFLRNLNRWILASGIAAVCAGAALVFLVSTTVTRPLGELVSGVRALERGDFDFPLDFHGSDEVSTVTAAFDRMRRSLRDTQQQLLEAEQLATIGRMASTMSHDLRHPLTAVLAYAEFLSEQELTEAQRKDFFQEIRIAVNRMLDEINSLLGFSKERQPAQPVYGRFDAVIERAIKAVKALPEFEFIVITFHHADACVGSIDNAKLERVMLNLLFNAAEAVPPGTGRIDVSCERCDGGIIIRVTDNGPGIPDEIAESLFRPFVSRGKEKGIGLGLTVVQNIMRQHDGEVVVERTGPAGSVFRLHFPDVREVLA